MDYLRSLVYTRRKPGPGLHEEEGGECYEHLLPSESNPSSRHHHHYHAHAHAHKRTSSFPLHLGLGGLPIRTPRHLRKPLLLLRHLLTPRRILLILLSIPTLLVLAILSSGVPPTYGDIRRYEAALPQHQDVQEEGGRYLRFPDHLWGHGLNNVLQETLALAHLATSSNRSYVFEDYTWSHLPLPYTIYDFALRPTRIPLNAFIAGPAAGGSMEISSGSASSSSLSPPPPRAVSASFYSTHACPPSSPRVTLSTRLSPRSNNEDASGPEVVQWWVRELAREGVREAKCVEVRFREEEEDAVEAVEGGKEVEKDWEGNVMKRIFDMYFFGSPRLLTLYPSLKASPVLKNFAWSPLVLSAVERNFVLFQSSREARAAAVGESISRRWKRALFTSSSSSSSSSNSVTTPATAPATTAPLQGLIALHIRRGDYIRHCPRLANWGSGYMGFNQFQGLVDRFDPRPRPPRSLNTIITTNSSSSSTHEEGEANTDDATLNHYLTHCLPSIPQIVSRLQTIRAEHPTPLRRLYVLSNAWGWWLDELRAALVDGVVGGEVEVEVVRKEEEEVGDRERERTWDSMGTSLDLVLDSEQRYVSAAVDMAIAERAEVFVGNGFSSMTANIVMLRMAKGLDASSNRFW